MTADLAQLAADPSFLERSADPAEFIIQACERAKVWLREVLDHGDIDQIVEVKSQAEAIRVYSMQKQLGKDAELSAAEVVRRAERGIGVAIRRGQDAGEIRARGQSRVTHQPDHGGLVRSPTEFATDGELNGSGSKAGIYGLTDDVTAEEFETAVASARADGNLSRANVVRKIRNGHAGKADPADWIPAADDRSTEAVVRRRELIRDYAARGYSSRQLEQMLGTLAQTIRQIAREMGIEITADQFVSGTRRHDSTRIVRETVHSLEGLVMGLELVDLGQLDPAEAGDWVASLSSSTRTLNRFLRQLKETTR